MRQSIHVSPTKNTETPPNRTKNEGFCIERVNASLGTTTLKVFVNISEDNHQLSIFRIKKTPHMHF